MDFCEGPVDLMLGDCLERLSEIEDQTVHLTVTSPPYDNLRSYNGVGDQWSERVWRGALSELYRVTVEGGVVVWIVADATVKGSETGTSFKQALFAMECGFNLHDTMIWDKGGFTAVGSLQVRYAPVFEYMLVFSRGRIKTFNPIQDRKNKNAGKINTGGMRLKDGTMRARSNIGRVTNNYGVRHNIWRISPNGGVGKNFGHPATFPIQLAHDHIASWSDEGDTVLDPFMGSGTTGVAAINLKRKFIGIELEPDYYASAATRIYLAVTQ